MDFKNLYSSYTAQWVFVNTLIMEVCNCVCRDSQLGFAYIRGTKCHHMHRKPKITNILEESCLFEENIYQKKKMS